LSGRVSQSEKKGREWVEREREREKPGAMIRVTISTQKYNNTFIFAFCLTAKLLPKTYEDISLPYPSSLPPPRLI
jgi:hypothetical protein